MCFRLHDGISEMHRPSVVAGCVTSESESFVARIATIPTPGPPCQCREHQFAVSCRVARAVHPITSEE